MRSILLALSALFALGAVRRPSDSSGVGSDALLPPPEDDDDVVASLNARFLAGRPANRLAEVGLVMRQVDRNDVGHDDKGMPWVGDTRSWVKHLGFDDRLSGAVVSKRLPYLFSTTSPGVVFRPSALEDAGVVACGCPHDCGTYQFFKHTPLAAQCAGQHAPAFLRHNTYLASNLLGMLAAHEQNFTKWRRWCTAGTHGVSAHDRDGCRYNEVLLSAAALNRTLPHAVEGVWYPINAPRVDAIDGTPRMALKVQREFARSYGVRLPLLVFDIAAAHGGRAPFALARAHPSGADLEAL